MHWTDNKLKKGQRRSLHGGTSPVIATGDTFSSTSNTGDSYDPSIAAAPLQGMSPHSHSQPQSIVRPEQNHPTVVAPTGASSSQFSQSQSSPTKSPSKARSFFRGGGGHHHTSSSEGGAHINTAIPSPSLHMPTSTSTSSIAAGAGAGQEDDAQLLHIKLKQEAQERALRTSPRSSSISSPNSKNRHASSNLSYDAQARDHDQGHGHARSSSLQGSSSIAPPSTSPNSTAAGGGTNAGWYMTTGVLPAVIQTPAPGQSDLGRSGSLGQRSKLSKYGSLFDATGLDRSGTGTGAGTGTGNGTQRSGLSTEESEQQAGYKQNVTGLRSDILDHTADATAANRSIPPHSIGYQAPAQSQSQSHSPIYDQWNTSSQHGQSTQGAGAGGQQNISAIPVSMAAASAGNQQHGIPDAVTNAAQTAQHRRNISRDGGMLGGSPTRVQHAQLPHSQQQGAGANANNQGRFQEEMNMVGRQSEDTPRGSNLGMLPATLAGTGPSRGDHRNADGGAQGGGLSSYNRGDLPNIVMAQGQHRDEPSGRALPVLPAEMGENLPASEIARQREMQNAYAAQGAREEPRVAAAAVGISDPPTSNNFDRGTNASQGQTRGLPSQQKQRQEVVNTATQGPSYQTTRTSEPKVVSQQTSSYLEHPVPNISFPAPTHPNINDLFGNIAQPIPHYMFVNYTASICQECVDSEKKMYALTHGGEKWRYVYSDPDGEKEIASDDPNTRKTGRQEYKDEVSVLSTTANGTESWNKDGKGPCQCEQCLKNREIVKYAAENGLIEKIFEGRRHPASELIETITTTTIVRAPIIRETITTIWCEEPNCMECAVKQREYDEAQRMKMMELAMNGLVVHETGGSDHYEGYENWLNVNGARGAGNGASSSTSSATASDVNGKSGIDRLLKIAGNPRQEHLRRMPGTTAEFEGEIIGYDDEEIAGRGIEHARPSHGNVLQYVKSGLEGRL